jgi:DNA-binding MarR family transcriptional regulator/GNAT superfamily N-acetyltransferase
MDPMIARVRSFNRTVTHRIGALDSGFLGRDRSLGASRVLFEIGAAGAEVRTLRARLGLDSGYMSRLLRSLGSEGLIKVRRSREDARVRFLSLTAAGRRELERLNRLSDEKASSILEPLSERQRTTLTEAMEAVERLLTAGLVSIEVEDPASPASRHCLARYYEELAGRFGGGFDPGKSISATPGELTPPRGYFLVARLGGEAVGCGALKCHAELGEIKRMWVASSCRGLGIARRLLSRLESLARQRKLPLVRLETNESLTEAQALYRGSGYREVPAFNSEPYAHHWFEKSLTP